MMHARAISSGHFKSVDIDAERLTHPFWVADSAYNDGFLEGEHSGDEGGVDSLEFVPPADAALLRHERLQ